MGIFKQAGSDFYYLKFEKDGRQYKRSTGCTDLRKAKAWDTQERRRAIVNEASEEAEAEAERSAAETEAAIAASKRFDFKRALTYYLGLSQSRGEKQEGQISNYWLDFAAWSEKQGIKTLDQVSKGHAAAYLAMLTKSGRFGESRIGKGSQAVSARTRNAYHINLKAIFAAAMEPAEITKNPFDLPKVANDSEERDAFEIEELRAILDAVQDSTPLRALVVIAACTGLRTGDACLLEWTEVDLRDPVGFIRKKTSKTGKAVSIPIMPPLRRLLEEMKKNPPELPPFRQWTEVGQPKKTDRTAEEIAALKLFVCPPLADQYQRNPSKLSRDFGDVLEKLGIAKEKKVAGRSRVHVFKDLHSLRHTFVYLAAEAGIPLAVVQGIVGHASQRMTEHYANHATDKAKAEAMKKLPDFFSAAATEKKKTVEVVIEAEVGPPSEADTHTAKKWLSKALKSQDLKEVHRLIEQALAILTPKSPKT